MKEAAFFNNNLRLLMETAVVASEFCTHDSFESMKVMGCKQNGHCSFRKKLCDLLIMYREREHEAVGSEKIKGRSLEANT